MSAPKRAVVLTDDEHAVVDSLMHDWMMRDVVAGRPQALDNIRTAHRSGGDAFTTAVWAEKGAIVRRWYQPTPRTFHDTCPAYCGKPGYQPVERMHVDGRHVASWNSTEPVRVARITHRRLIAWAEALTAEERRALLDEPRPEPEKEETAVPAPYFADDSVTLHLGDALTVARTLDTGSVDCIVTSPPYFGLRSYLDDGHPDKASEHGAEPDPRLFVERLVRLFRELGRVLADDGTLWVNLGDSYSAKRTYQVDQSKAQRSRIDHPYDTTAFQPAKNLLGMPWRTALALQDDGWILRNDVIWSKPNAMPESVTDRLSSRHEHLFMLAKSQRYYFDLDAIREQYDGDRDLSRRSRSGATNKENSVPRAWPPVGGTKQEGLTSTRSGNVPERGAGRNPGDVWEIATQPFPGAHFATMPVRLAERCIQAGCKPGGTVLDPFSGSGTTGLAAARHGRRYVGIDLNADYLNLSLRTRLQAPTLDLGGTA